MKLALEYSVHAMRPTGQCAPWGDSESDRSSIAAAIYGYLAFEDTRWLQAIYRFVPFEVVMEVTHENIWVISEVDEYLEMLGCLEQEIQGDNILAVANWQRENGQVMIRTEWSEQALSVMFGSGVSGSSHEDSMGFDLTAYGRPWLWIREESGMRRYQPPGIMSLLLTVIRL